MSRWQPDAQERLKRAALELFAEQGFAATTVPEITARAGLTTRTFFRHFADKREVLFGGEEIPVLAERLMTEAPPSLDPVTLIVEGLKNVADTRFEPRREEIRAQRAIIRSDEGLRERELHKRAVISDAIRTGFVRRGLPRAQAALLAELGTALLSVALDEWLDQDGDRRLSEIIPGTLATLRAVLGNQNAQL
jgi:AcrR family transcriptional regulator